MSMADQPRTGFAKRTRPIIDRFHDDPMRRRMFDGFLDRLHAMESAARVQGKDPTRLRLARKELVDYVACLVED